MVICELCHVSTNSIPEGYHDVSRSNAFHGLKPEFYALAAGTKSDKDVRIPSDNKQIQYIW